MRPKSPKSPSAYNGLPWERYFSLAMILIGVSLLGYVGTQYYGMHREQQRLQAKWEQEQKASDPAHSKDANTASQNDGLIRLVIPKINLSAFVLEGTTNAQLRNGPGRIIGTAMPGESGNSVISAHRDTFFRHIYELTKGDTIEIQRKGKTLKFQVTGKKIVDPEDLSVLQQSNDPRLTLITCYPIYYIGPAPQRLVVFSKLDDTIREQAKSATVANR